MNCSHTECRICYTVQQTFTDCAQCLKKVCSTCFSKLRRLQCPYCRHEYMEDIVYSDDEKEDLQFDDEEFIFPHAAYLQIHREVNPDRTQRRTPSFIPLEDEEYESADRYFNINQGLPDIIQDFRNDLRRYNQNSIVSLTNQYVAEYISGQLDMDDLMRVLQHARQLHR